MTEKIIKEAYYNPITGFTGADKLYRTLQKQGHNVSRRHVKDFLQKQELVQITKKNTGKSGSFVPPYPRYEYQIDLIYLDNRELNQKSYGLVCIDTFSKIGDVELIKKKNANDVVDAMEKILQRHGDPEYVYCDEGSEFKNSHFLKLMKDHNIVVIFTLTHAPMVERLNRTLKELLYKYLRSSQSKTITNILPKILENYNNSYHKTIQMAPNEVNSKNQHIVLENIRRKATVKVRDDIKVGDRVRVQLKKKKHEKGYRPKFSEEIYSVESKDGPYYTIAGLDRKYLRAFLQKIGEVERVISPADLEGTVEGRLRELAKSPIDPESLVRKEKLEKELSIHVPREKRKIKKPKRYT